MSVHPVDHQYHCPLKYTPVAENGDIVVAMIEDEATVKRIYYETGRIRLQPENDAYAPIYATEVTVLGRVIALQREM
jgi:repressor LexA